MTDGTCVGGALQPRRWCVLYRKDGREHATSWFLSRAEAEEARAALTARYGPAAVYID